MPLNEQQKAFRRQIKEYEKEKRSKGIEEPLSYVNENSRPWKYVKTLSLASIIPILILLWNTYAFSTWIKPVLWKLGFPQGNVRPVGNTFSINTKSKQALVSEYIQNYDKILNELIALLNLCNFETPIQSLEENVNDANYEIVKQLQEFVNGQIDLGEKIVDAYIAFKENRNNANAQRIN